MSPYLLICITVMGVFGILIMLVRNRIILQQIALEASRLRVQETLVSIMMQDAPVLLVATGARGLITLFNRHCEETTGYSEAEALGKPFSQLLIPKRLRRLHSGSQEWFATMFAGAHTQSIAWSCPCKDGTEREIHWCGTQLTDEDGNPTGFLGIGQDVTEQRAAEQEAQRQAVLLQALLDSLPDLVYFKDDAGKFLAASQMKADLWQTSPEDMVGKTDSDFVSESEAQEARADEQQVLKTGEAMVGESKRIRHSDGAYQWYSTTIAPYHDASGIIAGVVSLSRDITKQQELEQMLHKTQRMAAMDSLARGVTRDFNSVLQVITGRASLMLASGRFGDKTNEDLQEMIGACKRGASLAHQLLAFSGQTELCKEVSDLGKPVREVDLILKQALPKTITVESSAQANLWPVDADPYQIEQVLLNMAINASEAMPNGGTLEIQAENFIVDEEYVQRHSALSIPVGPYVLVTVSDDGIGMDEQARARVFEPYYTTKNRAEHTGLSLAVAHGIIESHNGFVDVASEPGKGTTFYMYLPAVPSAPVAKKQEGEFAANCGPITVLVVDDEPAIVSSMWAILESLDCEVVAAHDGEEAIEVFRTHAEDIDLVLLDLVMPKMGGEDCLEELLEIAPDVTVVVLTGEFVDSGTRERLGARVKGFLSKPVDISTVHRAVDEALRQD